MWRYRRGWISGGFLFVSDEGLTSAAWLGAREVERGDRDSSLFASLACRNNRGWVTPAENNLLHFRILLED
jgi:hypothetical protein